MKTKEASASSPTRQAVWLWKIQRIEMHRKCCVNDWACTLVEVILVRNLLWKHCPSASRPAYQCPWNRANTISDDWVCAIRMCTLTWAFVVLCNTKDWEAGQAWTGVELWERFILMSITVFVMWPVWRERLAWIYWLTPMVSAIRSFASIFCWVCEPPICPQIDSGIFQ